MESMKNMIVESFRRHLTLSLGKRPGKSSELDLYQALALSIRMIGTVFAVHFIILFNVIDFFTHY